MLKKLLVYTIILLSSYNLLGQDKLPKIDYSNPKEYEIAKITISGVQFLDHNALIQLSGLKASDKIIVPGDKLTNAVKKLWKQGLFSDVKLRALKVEGGKIYLDIFLQERARLSSVNISGARRSQIDDLKEKLKLKRGGQVTDNVINKSKNIIKDYFVEKGYYNVDVNIIKKNDTTLQNAIILNVYITKNNKVKIENIEIEGNVIYSDKKIRRLLKKTKRKRWYGLFKSSKYIESAYESDKELVTQKYFEKGYRDFKILSDSIYKIDDRTLGIKIKLSEGNKYFFRKITWVGNTKFSSEELSRALKIKKGDIFDQGELDKRLTIDEDAVSNLYMDDGYLFFNITPTEIQIENDSIDIEMRIYEGKQARLSKIIITGNTRTNDHVVRREIRTLPGDLFKKSDIIRTVRELAQLGHFDPEQLVPRPIPNQAEGTVDIEYALVEKANDQIEISGGWGAGMIVGTLGLSFNNFSTRNFFQKEAWQPLPTGDGQKLSIRAQTNGKRYQGYNLTFVEPWLGGRKPNSFTLSLFYSLQSNGLDVSDIERRDMKVSGASIGFGQRLKWPDDYFTLYNELSYQRYDLNNWTFISGFSNGTSNNLSLKTIFSRNSIDNPIYTRTGSKFSLGLEFTPPFSLISGNDYSTATDTEKFEWIEYHKWTLSAEWYTQVIGRLVFKSKAEYGFLGNYNSDIGPSPFEGFSVGGDMMGYYSFGKDIVPLRGYDNGTLSPSNGGNIYTKYNFELRYLISPSPQATVYGFIFMEAANSWYDFDDFNPYNLYRSSGVGVRIFLPMLGMLGVDWGYGFDAIGNSSTPSGSHFHFVLGQQF